MTTTFKPYPKYKPSGVEWLGDIPEHWEVIALNRLALTNNAGEVIDKSHWGGAEELLYTCAINPLQSDFDGFPDWKRTGARDLLLTRNGTPYVHIPRINSIYTNVVQRVTLIDDIDKAFVAVALQHSANNMPRYGVSIDSLNYELWKKLPITIPLPEEQNTIANFLDSETAKIDETIKELEKSIELLNEEKTSLINEYITGKTNPETGKPYPKYKPSGVEWLGDIPEHWEVVRINSVADKITNGFVGPTRDIFVEHGVRYLQSLHIKKNKIVFGNDYYVSPEWSDAHKKSILREGDVLIVQTGDVGQAAVVPKEFEGCNCHALIIVSPNSHSLWGPFLSWFLQSSPGFYELKRIQTGALHPHLNCRFVKDVSFALPSMSEQEVVTEFLNATTERLSALISEKESLIETLKEYRTSLIHEAVTGKIDLRKV